MIKQCKPETVGNYQLTIKTGSDNFRESVIQDIIARLKDEGIKVIIYEPALQNNTFEDLAVENNFAEFKESSDVIVANRLDNELKEIIDKVYNRDFFSNDCRLYHKFMNKMN